MKIFSGAKKIIMVIIIITGVINLAWFLLIKGPVFLNWFFPKKVASEPVKLLETNPFKTDTNPFSDSYNNPFSVQK